MNLITIGFSRPKKPTLFSKAIMAILGTNYSHIYVRFKSLKYGRDLIYQASHLMVNFMGGTRFEEQNFIVTEFSIPVDEELYVKIMQFCIDNAGVPYAIMIALGMWLQHALAKVKIRIENPWKNSEGYVCSTLVAYLLVAIMGQKLSQEPRDMDPHEMMQSLARLKPIPEPAHEEA